MPSFDEQVKSAIDMLPKQGSDVEFNAYKASLLSANPENGVEVFRFMLLNKLISKVLKVGSSGKPEVYLSRLA